MGKAHIIYKGKRFGDWLGCYDFDAEIIINDYEFPYSFVWNAGDKLTELGKRIFARILNAPYQLLSNGNIEVLGDAPEELGELFTSACAGYVADSLYKKWFTE